MRLFVAAYPSPEAVAHLAAALPPLGSEWRPTPADQWHLTLSFLAEVPEAVVPDLADRLARAASRTPPMVLAFAGAGAFRSIRRAGVLWAGVVGDESGLARLAERSGAAARRSGIAVGQARYRPHLTLARCRRPGGTDATAPVAAMTAYAGPRWPVSELVLVRSYLGSAVRHERLAGWPLSGAPAG